MGITKFSHVSDRAHLVNALTSVAKDANRAQRFLEGLSWDELRYIADYFGATVLDPDLRPSANRSAIAKRIERFQQMSAGDSLGRTIHQSHRMILLLEFLSSINQERGAFAARAGVA